MGVEGGGHYNSVVPIRANRRVLIWEDCSGTWQWTVAVTGGDDVHEFATVASDMSTNGMHLKTRTTDAADGDTTEVYKVVGYPIGGRVVARQTLASPDVSAVEYIQTELIIYDGTRKYSAGVRVSPNGPKVHYWSSDGSWVQIPAIDYGWGDKQYCRLEFTVDLDLHEYLKVVWLGAVVDLSGIEYEDTGASTSRKIGMKFVVETKDAAPAEAYINDIYFGEIIEL